VNINPYIAKYDFEVARKLNYRVDGEWSVPLQRQFKKKAKKELLQVLSQELA